MKPIHLLIPMSGQGTRYQKAGYTEPKPMIPVSGIPMIERLLANFPLDWPVTFVMAENHRNTELPGFLRKLRPGGRPLFIGQHKLGPGHAIASALEGIDPESPVLVSYCDYAMVWDADQFRRFVESSACDAAVISYRGFHAHYLSEVTYAYSRLDGERVVEVKEKGSFTSDREQEYASSGGYYFRTAGLLREAIEHQKSIGLQLNGEYYTSLTVQALLLKNPQSHVRVFEIPGFFQWGTPDDLRDFEYWERTFSAYNRFDSRCGQVDQVLMPMAGLGSRFAHLTKTPKPLIPVFGRRMFQSALASMPRADKSVIVTLDSIAPLVEGVSKVISLSQTPAGQALTTEAGLGALDPAKEVIVTACDHAIVLDPSKWRAFRADPDCDAAVFTVQGFPGVRRKPAAFSYVVPVADPKQLTPFKPIERISLKKRTTDQPEGEQLLVGTFWFRRAEILLEGIAALKRESQRMNGELYLDTVFDVLKKMGRTSRIVPLEGYINWGDPDSLAEAFYWQEIFCGRQIDRRQRFPEALRDA